jgi:predicted extracellular nuclease
MGDQFEDITGVVQQTFGFYYILPLTAVKKTVSADSTVAPSPFLSQGKCTGITVGSYNVENLAPTSSHLPKVAGHIVNYLKTPDLMFVQEIQDNSGPTDDGVVASDVTLTTLVNAIKALSNVTYSWTYISPVNDLDGGQPGGNIRQAYLYRAEVLSLYKPNIGGSTDATAVVPGKAGAKGLAGAPTLSFNPGRIEPANDAWTISRKPLAAVWRAKGASKPFYTVNVHWASKGGSTGLQGDVRPPINGVVDARNAQANVTGVSSRQRSCARGIGDWAAGANAEIDLY